MISENIFRAYDIRGVYGKDLTADVAEKIGKAFGEIIGENKKIIIGRDLRSSGDILKKSLIDGILSTGIDVIDIGIVPTPLVYFSICSLEKDGGIAITGSHLTSEWNGMKLCREKAISLSYETGIEKIKQMILDGNLGQSRKSGVISNLDIVDDYVRFVTSSVRIEKPLKVIVDVGNGTCGEVVSKIFQKINYKAKILFAEPDERFPNHVPNPLMEDSLKTLQEEVIRENADIGVAFDCDGDRVGFVDDKGRIIRGDIALILFAKAALEKEGGLKFLFEVRCSRLTYEMIKGLGGVPEFTRVGHCYIMKKAIEDGAAVTGELSGHFYFKENYYYDDGFFAMLKMLEFLSKSDRKLSEIVDEFPKYFSSPEIRIPYPDEKKFALVERVKKRFSELGYQLVTIDGVRVEFEDGWGLIRASNTEPMLVLRSEAETDERLREIKEELLEVTREEAKIDSIKI